MAVRVLLARSFARRSHFALAPHLASARRLFAYLFACVLALSLAADAIRAQSTGWTDRFRRPGLDGRVRALHVAGGELFAEGEFDFGGAFGDLTRLARWDGVRWLPALNSDFWVWDSCAWQGRLWVIVYDRESSDPVTLFWDGATWQEGSISATLAEVSLSAGPHALLVWGQDLLDGTWALELVDDGGSRRIRGAEGGTYSWTLLEARGQTLAARATHDDQILLYAIEGDSLRQVAPALPLYYEPAIYATDQAVHVLAYTDLPTNRRALLAWRGEGWEEEGVPANCAYPYALSGDSTGCHLSYFDAQQRACLARGTGDPVVWEQVEYQPIPDDRVARVVAEWNGGLVIAGDFESVSHVGAESIVLHDAEGWHALGDGMGLDGGIAEAVVAHQEVWVRGAFSTVGALWSPGLARFDGDRWQTVSPPPVATDGYLTSLRGAPLLTRVTGAATVGDTLAAYWDGDGWVPLLSRTRFEAVSVNGTATADQATFLLGSFWLSGDQYAPILICDQDGVGEAYPELRGTAQVGAVDGDRASIYGNFSLNGAAAIEGIAQRDGAHWSISPVKFSRFDTGDRKRPSDALAFGDLVLFAGDFDLANDTFAPGIVAWDGRRLRPLESDSKSAPRPYRMERIALLDGRLVAASGFVDSVGALHQGVLSWDGRRWRQLGEDRDVDGVAELSLLHDHVYVWRRYESSGRRMVDEWSGPLGREFPGAGRETRLLLEPNPARDHLRLMLDRPLPNGGGWEIHDAAGRRVARGVLPPSVGAPRVVSLEREVLERLPSGVYLVTLDDGARRHQARMVRIR